MRTADPKDSSQRRRHQHRDGDRNEDTIEDDSELHTSRRHRHRRRHRSRSGSIEESNYSRHHRSSRDEKKDKDRERDIRSPRQEDKKRSEREDSYRSKRRSRSPKRHRRSRSRSASPLRRSRKPLPSQEESYRGQSDAVDKAADKQKPNFKPTGLLAAETNKVSIGSGADQKSIVLKYHEPAEARKPPSSEKWALFIFKGASQEPLDTIPLHTRSCWLLGREAAVADIATEHPSCSKQHAVFQFRHTVKKDEWGEKKEKVGLYVLDLESANGTFLNGEQIEGARYVQCMNGDMIKFGESAREYVIILPPKE